MTTNVASAPHPADPTLPGHLKAAASRAQPRELEPHVDRMAQGGQAYLRRIQELASAGQMDRAKVQEHLRIVRGFNEANGKDVTHGMLELLAYLLPRLPATTAGAADGEGEESARGRTRSQPPEVDELACYMVSRGGKGAERVFCSEACNQLFISTDELRATVAATGLTVVSIWASFISGESLARLMEALATVFFQRDGPAEVELELECETRIGLKVACQAQLSFRLHDDGESTLMLVLAVKADAAAGRALAPPSRSHPGVPTRLGADEAAAAAPAASNGGRRSHAAERRAALAARKRELSPAPASYQQEEVQPPPAQRSRPQPLAAAAAAARCPSSRPPAKRAPVSSKRRRLTTPITWSQEGPPLPEAMLQRLISKSPHLANLAASSSGSSGSSSSTGSGSGGWCRDEKTGTIVWSAGAAAATAGCGSGTVAARRRFFHQRQVQQEVQAAVAAAQQVRTQQSFYSKEEELRYRQQQQLVAEAEAAEAAEAEDDVSSEGIAPFAYEGQLQGQAAPALSRESSSSAPASSSTTASSSGDDDDDDDDDDAVWAWADKIWEQGSGSGLGQAEDAPFLLDPLMAGADAAAAPLADSPAMWMFLDQAPM